MSRTAHSAPLLVNCQAEVSELHCGTPRWLFCHDPDARTPISTPNQTFPCIGPIPVSKLLLSLSNLFKDSHASLKIAVNKPLCWCRMTSSRYKGYEPIPRHNFYILLETNGLPPFPQLLPSCSSFPTSNAQIYHWLFFRELMLPAKHCSDKHAVPRRSKISQNGSDEDIFKGGMWPVRGNMPDCNLLQHWRATKSTTLTFLLIIFRSEWTQDKDCMINTEAF